MFQPEKRFGPAEMRKMVDLAELYASVGSCMKEIELLRAERDDALRCIYELMTSTMHVNYRDDVVTTIAQILIHLRRNPDQFAGVPDAVREAVERLEMKGA